ncbi:tumor necrosis factor receptor superfamily member 1B-like isoform X2 [Melanerpes formicivorus]|uniref:tumor necrosis factor receptor superfamily member 1B-like isoform X2 n=1 Tax=Melanerpes formicivorus TaxID=211600 RepID=UPI00358F99F5
MGLRWALLVALLQAAGGRKLQSAQCNNPTTEFYDEGLNKCCRRCPPGEYRTERCSHTADTKCSPCRPNTYTAVWNQSPQCFACSPPCRKGFVQSQACTKSQDRICSCPPNEWCTLKISENCKICQVHSKCGKGYRVSRRDSTDTECTPCPPGTFSHEESYATSCIPHTVCKSVAVPGSSINDTVCSDSRTAVATALPHTILNLLLSQSSASNQPQIITQPVILNSVPEMSHIIGSVAGPLLLVLIIAGLGFCLVYKKKAPVCSPSTTKADLSSSPTEKEHDKKVRNTGLQNSSSSEQEEHHLLETPGSISSSPNNSIGSARVTVISSNNGKKATEGFQQQHSNVDHCKLHSGDRHSSASSEHSGNGGTQVNVTCIVKVCSPDCSSQFPEQPSSTSMDCGNTPKHSPAGEKIPLSKEENLLKNETEIRISVGNEGSLLQDLLLEETKFPQGIQDVKMKNS